MAVVRQAIACLAGKTRSETSFSDDAFDEDDFIRALKNGPPGSTNVHYGVLKTFVLLLHVPSEIATTMIPIIAVVLICHSSFQRSLRSCHADTLAYDATTIEGRSLASVDPNDTQRLRNPRGTGGFHQTACPA